MPDSTHCTLKWGARLTGATATAFGATQISANDVRDPGLSTAATTAQGYSQYAALYNHAMVVASRIKVRASHGSTADGIGSSACESTVCVFPSRGSTTVNDMASAQAQPGAKRIDFDVGGQKTFSISMDVARFVGMTRQQMRAQDSFWSNPSTSPTSGMLWNLCTQSSVAQTNLSTFLEIECEYDVIFFSRASVDLAFEKSLGELVLARYTREQEARSRRVGPHLHLVEEKKVLPSETKEVQVDRSLPLTLPAEVARLANTVVGTSDKGWFMVRQGEAQTPKPDYGRVGRAP